MEMVKDEIIPENRIKVVHAMVQEPLAKNPKRYWHAWVETGERAHDWQLRMAGTASLPIQDFYELYKPDNIQKYTPDECAKNLLRNRHHGPWHDDVTESVFVESSLKDLYQSAENAFPHTTKRQYATHPVKIRHIQWVPFVGMKTLFVKGSAMNEGREYNPTIVFKKVTYHEAQGLSIVTLQANDGKTYYLSPLSLENTDVLVRCNCHDFRWRFSYYNSLEKSLQGPKPKKYEPVPGSNRPPANPTESSGMCKHLMKFAQALRGSTIIG
jgi:hypothetical protein